MNIKLKAHGEKAIVTLNRFELTVLANAMHEYLKIEHLWQEHSALCHITDRLSLAANESAKASQDFYVSEGLPR